MTANVLILSAAGMLVSAYLMVGQKALFTTIRLYGLQSLLLAIVASTIAISDSRPELFVTAALTLVLKTVLIPWFLMRTVDRIGIHREIEPFLNVPRSLLICLGLTVVGYRVSTGFEEGDQRSHPPSHRRGAVAAADRAVPDGDAEEGHHADPGLADRGERGLPGGGGRDHGHAAHRGVRDRVRRHARRPRPRHSRAAHRRPVRIDGRQPAVKLERIGVNLLVWTLVVPSLTAAIGRSGSARAFQGSHHGRRPGADVRAVSGDGQPVPWRRNPGAFGDALRVDGLSALVLVLCGFVGLLSGVYGIGYLRRNEARGLVTPRMRREFYGLIPAYVFAMLLVSVSNNLGIMWIAVELTTLASVFLITFHDTDTSLEAAWKFLVLGSLGLAFALLGTVLMFASGQGSLGEGMASAAVDAFHASGAGAASLHAAARRRVCPDRLRHQGGSCADAHVEARRVSRSAVASRGADGRRYVEWRAVLRPADPSDFEGLVGTGVLGGACC